MIGTRLLLFPLAALGGEKGTLNLWGRVLVFSWPKTHRLDTINVVDWLVTFMMKRSIA